MQISIISILVIKFQVINSMEVVVLKMNMTELPEESMYKMD